MKKLKRWILIVVVLAVLGYAYWKFVIPTHRVPVRSELVMLGDLDGDNRWTARDLTLADAFVNDPFGVPDAVACRMDINQNGLIDDDDISILRALVASGGDPYAAEDAARAKHTVSLTTIFR